MGKLTVAFLVTLFVAISSETRHPRFVRGTYTNTVTDTRVVTSLVPSSCIYVDATLPPCRNVRYLRFPNFLPNNWYSDDDPTDTDRSDVQIQTTTLGWGEYFGLYAPTVTVTTTEIHTSTVQDPRVVVTFGVKGCKPVKIPGGLNACPQDTPSISIQDILPTSTVLARPISSTVIDPHDVSTPKNARFIDLVAAKAHEEKWKGEGIEGSTYEQEDFETMKPTEKLAF